MQLGLNMYCQGIPKTSHFVDVSIDETLMLAAAARSLSADGMAVCAGASFTFDGASSRLAVKSVKVAVQRDLPGTMLLWSIPKGGFLLPTKIASGAEIMVLLGDPDATIMVVGSRTRCAVSTESGHHLYVDEDCWLWISPIQRELVLLSAGIPVPSGAGLSERRHVQRASVFETRGLPIAETIQRALLEADRFECFPKAPSSMLFDPWRESEYEDDDRYQVLQMSDMSAPLREFIIDWLRPFFGSARFYFQINRYEQGDHVLPHRDSFKQGLMMLTAGDGDGLCVQTCDYVIRVQDKVGRIVSCDTDAWHWVDPVKSAPRFTLVTIPEFRAETSLFRVSDHATTPQNAQ